MHRFRIVFAVVVLLIALPAAAGTVAVGLSLDQDFYYADRPLHLRVTVRNTGDEVVPNPIRTPLLSGLKFRKSGASEFRESKKKLPEEEPTRPETIAPHSFYGTQFDVRKLFPALDEPGTYEVYWAGPGLVSEMVVVTVIEAFDPQADYAAELRTNHGTIRMDLFEDRSPVAVRAFVDMARTGVYDGLLFSEAHRDAFVVAGDPATSDVPRRVIRFPAELAPVPLVAGSVALKPVSAAPMANSSTFMITLRPQTEWTGQVTVLGQVTEGLDVVRKVSQVPTTMRGSRPFFRPLQDVRIEGVRILEKPASTARGGS